MTVCIIYPTGDGIAIITPTGLLPLADVARKDVPQGTPYRYVDADAVPVDRTFRDAWEADFSEPDGYGDPDGYWTSVAAAEATASAEAGA